MGTTRMVAGVLRGRPTLEGAGVRLTRVFGFQQPARLDPFLLLDEFRSDDPEDYRRGFPWHPHRGIETITYLLHGAVEHGDSLGNAGVIGAGDVQWMTAGSGIVHEEMPKPGTDGLMWGFQLWANLPASHKMMAPRYQEVAAADIPEVVLAGGARARVICGAAGGVAGAVRDIVTDPVYLDVTVPFDTRLVYPMPSGRTVIAYVIDGAASFGDGDAPHTWVSDGANQTDLDRRRQLGPGHLVVFDDGDQIAVTTGDRAVRFLLIAGRPIGEPVAWYGPIVMNTEEELRVAFEEYRNGTFVKHGRS